MVSLLMPVLAMGNRAVLVPSATMPLVATDFYQVLDTSDVPAGAVNIVTGAATNWRRRSRNTTKWRPSGITERRKGRRWWRRRPPAISSPPGSNGANSVDWFDAGQDKGTEYLRRATQVKNIWIPTASERSHERIG
jgi:aldehyde dehydrogenase (NAD+)